MQSDGNPACYAPFVQLVSSICGPNLPNLAKMYGPLGSWKKTFTVCL